MITHKVMAKIIAAPIWYQCNNIVLMRMQIIRKRYCVLIPFHSRKMNITAFYSCLSRTHQKKKLFALSALQFPFTKARAYQAKLGIICCFVLQVLKSSIYNQGVKSTKRIWQYTAWNCQYAPLQHRKLPGGNFMKGFRLFCMRFIEWRRRVRNRKAGAGESLNCNPRILNGVWFTRGLVAAQSGTWAFSIGVGHWNFQESGISTWQLHHDVWTQGLVQHFQHVSMCWISIHIYLARFSMTDLCEKLQLNAHMYMESIKTPCAVLRMQDLRLSAALQPNGIWWLIQKFRLETEYPELISSIVWAKSGRYEVFSQMLG